jgi:hypothetical protein
VFFTILQVKQCLCLIFHIFQFSHHIKGPTVCIFHFSRFLSTSRHIPGHLDFVSHFPCFSLFLALTQVPTVCIYHFSRFPLFLHIFQVLLGVILILQVFQCFSQWTRSQHVNFSFSSFVICLAIIQVLQCVFLIFNVFQCSPHIPVLPGEFFIFHICHFYRHFPGPTVFEWLSFYDCQVSCHMPGTTVHMSHFSRFSVFLAIF